MVLLHRLCPASEDSAVAAARRLAPHYRRSLVVHGDRSPLPCPRRPLRSPRLARRPEPAAEAGGAHHRRAGADAGGRGTGKTAALTARLAYLIRTRRAWPSEILCVTFTNKAAREMRHRVGQLIGDAVEGMPWLGTFHSICARMLRRHAELVGLQSNYTIIDTDDQLRVLKQLIADERSRREALARAPARRADRPLEEPRAQSRRPRCGRERGLCQRQGPGDVPALPGAAEEPQRLRFRRSACCTC